MRESKNLDASAVPKKYPNIAKIFDKEWFESEFKKEKEEMHLLARHFTYDEEDRISLHLIAHLEDYLATMQEEIAQKKHFYRGLRNKDQYTGTSAEIEIGALFKNMGFQVQLEPKIPGERSRGDAIISDGATKIFIEVSTKKGPEVNNKDRFDGVKVGVIKFQSPKIFRDKIDKKSRQLSGFCPSIIVLYLEPSSIPERKNIVKAVYDGIAWIVNGEVVHIEPGESAMDNSIISALLLYTHYFNNGCKIDKELYLNPKANISLPDSIITKFRDSGIEIKEAPIELERNYR